MRALVTGADGLLGSNLVRKLLDAGIGVRALLHPTSKSETLDGLDIERMRGDILDTASVQAAMKGCGSVFHVAASTAMWPPRDPKITAVNVTGTRNMLDAAEAAGVKRFVHVGSASSFGYGDKRSPGTETTPFRYAGMGIAYFDSKLEAQKLVLARAAEGRLDALVVNPTFMLGPYDSMPSSGKLIAGFVRLKPPFYPPGGRCFVHVGDVAEAMVAALEKGETGRCYILGNTNLDMGEFFRVIGRVTGVRAPSLMIPREIMLLAGRAGSAWADITRKATDITWEIAQCSCIGSYYSPARAVRELGMKQTPVETAVEDSVRWMRDNGRM
jgi:dihydroflavonol-4-reductase